MKNEQVTFANPNRPVRIQSASYEKDFLAAMHFHTELELLRVDSGMVQCYTDDQEYTLKEGEILFINSMLPHATKIMVDGSRTSFLQFKNPSSLKGNLHYLSHFLKRSGVPFWVFRTDDPDNAEISKYISTIVAEDEKKETAHDYYITANIYLIIALLHRKKLLPDLDRLIDRNAIRKIMPVLELIEHRYAENISLKELSETLNLNEHYFCRIFKKATGICATEYLNFVRVYQAHKLLTSELSISEIAHLVGFSSLSYFNRVFKKYYLCSPSAYKKIVGRSDNLFG